MTTPTIIASTGRESAELKACRLLVEGRVRILELAAGRCTARVNGNTGVYQVRYWFGTWRCTCQACKPNCSHVIACRRVTDIPPVNERRTA